MAPPPAQFNVLRVVLGALQSRALQAAQPGLYEQCLELVYALAAAPDTGLCVRVAYWRDWEVCSTLWGVVCAFQHCRHCPEASGTRGRYPRCSCWPQCTSLPVRTVSALCLLRTVQGTPCWTCCALALWGWRRCWMPSRWARCPRGPQRALRRSTSAPGCSR